MIALTQVMTTPANAAGTCYSNNQPQHLFTTCADGDATNVWAWGQYDVRYYSSPTLRLRTVASNGNTGELFPSQTTPYQTYIFLASIKGSISSLAWLRSIGIVKVKSCLSAWEAGVVVERCSPLRNI
jgi:hypothetical protein